MKPLLVVLAAGMGGGYTQLEPVGPRGETLMEYGVYDALRSGFGQALFVIPRDMESAMRETVLRRMKPADYALAYQAGDVGLPPEAAENPEIAGRTAPWGTVHGVLCGAEAIQVPAFAVMRGNAFYGPEAFADMGLYLGSPAVTQRKLPTVKQGYIVPYPLERALKPEGTAMLTACGIADGQLDSLRALGPVGRADGRIVTEAGTDSPEELPGDTPVSMDFWGFPRSILPSLRKYFFDFLHVPENLPSAECLLSDAVDWIIKTGLLRIRALPAGAEWFGLDVPADAADRIARLTDEGVYPSPLWR